MAPHDFFVKLANFSNKKQNATQILALHSSRSTYPFELVFAPIDSHESQLSIAAKTSSDGAISASKAPKS